MPAAVERARLAAEEARVERRAEALYAAWRTHRDLVEGAHLPHWPRASATERARWLAVARVDVTFDCCGGHARS